VLKEKSNVALPVLDVAEALRLLEGDGELLKELSQMFLEQSAGLLQNMRESLAADEPAQLERLAHTLKGSCANLGARALAQAAEELEKKARAKALFGLDKQVDVVVKEVEQLKQELNAYLETEG
jgi:two-component system, sensor histidine kinase and response regulator